MPSPLLSTNLRSDPEAARVEAAVLRAGRPFSGAAEFSRTSPEILFVPSSAGCCAPYSQNCRVVRRLPFRTPRARYKNTASAANPIDRIHPPLLSRDSMRHDPFVIRWRESGIRLSSHEFRTYKPDRSHL